MSGSSGEKTEDPTPKRIRDSRKKGQVAKSKDIVTTTLVAGIFLYFLAMFPFMMEQVKKLLDMPPLYYEADFRDAFFEVITGSVITMAIVVAPILLIIIVLAFASHFFQFGFLLAFQSMKPDLNKLNPVNGFKRIFSVKNFVEFGKNVLKITVLSIIIYKVIKDQLEQLLHLPYYNVYTVFELLGPIMYEICKYILFIYIVISVFDFFFQKKQYIKELKMTKDEVKREYKEMEGDPQIKSQRKQLHREMIEEGAVDNTKKSSVLVTNPTHLAVAIYYDREKTPLPIVAAKGKDHLALRMRKAAEEAGVPVTENVPLAHSLYEEAALLKYIPREFIKPIAEVLRWVQQVKQQGH